MIQRLGQVKNYIEHVKEIMFNFIVYQCIKKMLTSWQQLI